MVQDFIFRHNGVFYQPVKIEDSICDRDCDFEANCDSGFEHLCSGWTDNDVVFKKLDIQGLSKADKLVDLCRQMNDAVQDFKTAILANDDKTV